MNKSNNITREEMWAKQCLSATDIDYAVWERDNPYFTNFQKSVTTAHLLSMFTNAITRMHPRISLIYWGMTVTR